MFPWLPIGIVIGVLVAVPLLRIVVRRAERRTRDAERRALEAERLAELGAMTGGLAHEIKNPLSTIGLNAQLLQEGLDDADVPDEQRDRLRRRLDALAREAERLRQILEDFLQFAGRVRLAPVELDLRRIVDELVDFYHPQCDAARVVLRSQTPAQPVTAQVDETLLKQAVLNLMINATQAMTAADGGTPPPPGTTRGELLINLEAGDGAARLHVIDTGPGIPPERIEEILRPYVSGRRGGTGLGLPTARRIVEEHGGRLEIASSPGKGSDFVIVLPAE